MKTTTPTSANFQAYEMQLCFERRAQLLRMIFKEQLAIKHYLPEVGLKVTPEKEPAIFTVAYRHFSHYIHPFSNPLFLYKAASEKFATSLNMGMAQVVNQLKEFHSSNAPNESANNAALFQSGIYNDSAKFLSLVHEAGVAVNDYVPKIQIWMDETGQKVYLVRYRHKFFLSREEKDKAFESSGTSLLECMVQVIDELMKYKNS
jgi:hypothetical protein